MILQHSSLFRYPPLFEHVKGHSGKGDLRSRLNERADRLAKEAACGEGRVLMNFTPEPDILEYSPSGCFQIMQFTERVKTYTVDIYHELSAHRRYRWHNRVIQRFNRSANPSIVCDIWKKKWSRIHNFLIQVPLGAIYTMERIAKFQNSSPKCPRCLLHDESLIHLLWECPEINKDSLLVDVNKVDKEAYNAISKILINPGQPEVKVLLLGGWWPATTPITNPKRAKRIMEIIAKWSWANWKQRSTKLLNIQGSQIPQTNT
eukprot:TRINITY_DN2540_c0_g1_i17.p1 TRINITY_DN2540_c0_g1~~TRINITY_DN2540_c0_g1_i17.p1  ORF type:complete len:261 (+),score=27.08 TRINITY_DN2540_c0_g1_i17:1242-2024(+)